MGLLQATRHRLNEAGKFFARHAATAGKVALAAAAVAGAHRAYHSDAANALRQQHQGRQLAREHGARLRAEYERDRARVADAANDDGNDDWQGYVRPH